MPFIRTTTSKPLTKEQITEIKCEYGRSISIVSGKNERQLMLAFHDDIPMSYQGDEKTACAMVEVSLFGAADPKELDGLTAAITNTLVRVASLSPERVYVNYLEFKYWGVSGGNV